MTSTENENENEKKNNNNDETNETNSSGENNWGDFLKAVVKSLITALILGLLGANYVFLTRINLDMFFPTEVSQRPYNDENKIGNKLPPLCSTKYSDVPMTGGKKMKGGSNTGCGIPINICDSKIFENKFFKGMFDYGFPYNLESKDDTFGSFFSDWFSNKVKYSYVWLRTLTKTLISFTSSLCVLTPEKANDIIPFIVGPIIMSLLITVSSFWFIPSMISIFVNETSDMGMLFSFIGLFFGWTWFLAMFTSFFQMFGLMFKLILLPIMMNPRKIIEIMGHDYNTYFMKLLFFIMVISAAFKNLNLIVAIVMTVIFLLNALPPNVKIPGLNNKNN